MKKINFDWNIESATEPYFKYDEHGLTISFAIYLGDKSRANDINNYISKHNLDSELEIPDEIYNSAGQSEVSFFFHCFSSFKLLLKDNLTLKYSESGVYLQEEKDEDNYYLFSFYHNYITVRSNKYKISRRDGINIDIYTQVT